MVGQLLDMRLVKLASSVGCTYSRYANDLTFSTNKKEFPPEIAKAHFMYSWMRAENGDREF